MLTTRDRHRRRPLSAKPDAIRQRKSRGRQRVGLALFKLYLPIERLELVVRARSNLPPDALVSKREIRKALTEGIEWWSSPWLNLKRHK
jgi:hypothetical protein